MTTAQESEELTRVGPGTLMGEFMRQYWIPAAMSDELAADGVPMRLMLLGEKLVAFRDSDGRVGVMDHRCPHRCASLFFGRNEESGLRCIYHGWKFDTEGNCVDMPNLRGDQDFKHKVKAKAYPAAERNGLIWVYMGKRRPAPPLPPLEVNLLPREQVQMKFIQRECSWLQSLEGDIDTSHFGFLHVGSVDPDDVPLDHPIRGAVLHRSPDYNFREMPFGTQYGAFRPADDGRTYWRFANFLFPFWTQQPQGSFPTHVGARAWVPMDDTHTMFVHLQWEPEHLRKKLTAVAPLKNGGTLPGSRPDHDFLPNGTGWFDRWRLAANADNDYQIDREAQARNEIFSGITDIHLQDQAVTESMGDIVDHTFEHLAPSDQMITRTRRHLLRQARAFRDTGQTPPGVDDPEILLQARAGFFVADPATDWEQAYAEQVEKAERPASDMKAAE